MYVRNLVVPSLLGLMLSLNAGAAIIQTALFAPVLPTGTFTDIDLESIVPPSQTNFVGTGFSVVFSGVPANQGVVQGQLNPFHAVPVAGPTPDYLTTSLISSPLTTNIANSGKYLSTDLGTIAITFTSAQQTLALLWGSVDDENTLTFDDGTIITGSQIRALAGTSGTNGFQGPGGSTYVLIMPDTGNFTTVTMSSGVVSFEAAGLVGSVENILVPEPSSLLLSLIGIGGVLLGSRKLKKS